MEITQYYYCRSISTTSGNRRKQTNQGRVAKVCIIPYVTDSAAYASERAGQYVRRPSNVDNELPALLVRAGSVVPQVDDAVCRWHVLSGASSNEKIATVCYVNWPRLFVYTSTSTAMH